MPFAFAVRERRGPSAIAHSGPRYLAGAAVCAVANNAILIGSDWTGLPLAVGVLLSWLIGGLIGYVWHARITYGEPLSPITCTQFLGGGLAGIPLAWGCLWLLSEQLEWPMWLAAPSATVALFCYHYLNALLAIRWTGLTWLRRRQCKRHDSASG